MAYYPKSQIKTNLYTNGAELVYKSNNQSYIGNYFKTSKGKYYTGKSPDDLTSVELILSNQININVTSPNPVFPTNNNLVFPYNVITPVNDAFFGPTQQLPNNPSAGIIPRLIPPYYKTRPTTEEFQLGKYNRYFCKKNNELIYIEISKETYTKLINQDPQIAYDLYTPTSILWQDQPSLNFNAVKLIEQNLKWYGFSQYFKGNFES
jgi:hypothetical protein